MDQIMSQISESSYRQMRLWLHATSDESLTRLFYWHRTRELLIELYMYINFTNLQYFQVSYQFLIRMKVMLTIQVAIFKTLAGTGKQEFQWH